MTRSTRTMALVLAFASSSGVAYAQQASPPPPAARSGAPVSQASGRITGMVVRAGTSEPMPSAAVAVRSATDSSLVGGGYTRADGTFRIDGLRPGTYTVRVRVIGYAPLIKTGVVVTRTAGQVEIGKLELTAVAAAISGVTVVAEREEVALAPDRNTYSVEKMPAASGGTAVDVLRNVPAVEVDGDNKLSLRGNENVVVQINGRISPMRGEQLGSFLAQLPANMVSRVEVVPNPSAKNDPEGMAGIVNIVLKENTDLGLSGGLTLGGGTTGQMNASGNLGYQHGALTLFANYGFMRDERVISGFTNREDRSNELLPYLNSDITGANSPRSHSLNASAEYKLGARGALSTDLIVSKRDFTRRNDNLYSAFDASRTLTDRSLRTSGQTNDDLMLDWTLTHKVRARQPGDGLATQFRINRSRGNGDLLLGDQTLQTIGAGTLGAAARETNATDERTVNWTLQSDLTRTLAPRTKFETGYKGTLRQMDNTFDAATFSDATAAFVPDLARSNTFAFDEQVNAVYGVLSRGVGKFDLQAGLRAEQVATRFDLATTSERFDNDYRSFYPSALAAYNLDATRQVKLSYSKRVTRPDTRQLNPFGFREDALNVFRGNPALRPEYTHAFELWDPLESTCRHASLSIL